MTGSSSWRTPSGSKSETWSWTSCGQMKNFCGGCGPCFVRVFASVVSPVSEIRVKYHELWPSRGCGHQTQSASSGTTCRSARQSSTSPASATKILTKHQSASVCHLWSAVCVSLRCLDQSAANVFHRPFCVARCLSGSAGIDGEARATAATSKSTLYFVS